MRTAQLIPVSAVGCTHGSETTITERLASKRVPDSRVAVPPVPMVAGAKPRSWEKLPPKIPIITLAQVEQVYQRAESEESALR